MRQTARTQLYTNSTSDTPTGGSHTMTGLIFGHTWEDIQAMQQGTYRRQIASGGKPPATHCDIEMLRDKGIDYIKGNGLHGIIDRLQTSGIIPPP